MTAEEFQAWAENPVTKWVFKAVKRASELQKDAWDKASWDEGEADPLLLTELRARADAYLAIVETPYERMCELNDEEPKES
ncbi:MAG: hypothetical protein JWR80_9481 [Bradyrhizobium sp.]|nr:hypothetical protein [Bradyrhizobium sp.]